ncbi:MAG TPA: four helix bundle protein [Candidatus Marinimicrobia bacterium]|nr:four helix bundle protein [Candidatus Neomarinimicrobiota bacterium]HQE95111.1 four helix bundle protein [Candidatus Neomarinimicrobiota bacterium]
MGRFKNEELLDRVFTWVNAVLDLVEIIPNTTIGKNIQYQLVKSSTSVGANLEEADAAYSRKEFTSCVNIAKRESKESRYWMKILRFRKMVDFDKLNPIINETEEIIRILFAIVKGTQNND